MPKKHWHRPYSHRVLRLKGRNHWAQLETGTQGRNSSKHQLLVARLLVKRHALVLRNKPYELGLEVVPEHQPVSDKGQRSVTLTTIDFVTEGWKGGVAITGFNKVRLKHLPQAGPEVSYESRTAILTD